MDANKPGTYAKTWLATRSGSSAISIIRSRRRKFLAFWLQRREVTLASFSDQHTCAQLRRKLAGSNIMVKGVGHKDVAPQTGNQNKHFITRHTLPSLLQCVTNSCHLQGNIKQEVNTQSAHIHKEKKKYTSIFTLPRLSKSGSKSAKLVCTGKINWGFYHANLEIVRFRYTVLISLCDLGFKDREMKAHAQICITYFLWK